MKLHVTLSITSPSREVWALAGVADVSTEQFAGWAIENKLPARIVVPLICEIILSHPPATVKMNTPMTASKSGWSVCLTATPA